MITPLEFYCQHVMPIAIDGCEISMYEDLCKVKAKLNEVITSQNTITDEWKNLETWINGELENIADKKLDGWLLDGTLEQIINQEIFGKLNELVNNNAKAIATLQQNETKMHCKMFSLYHNGLCCFAQIASTDKRINILIDGGANTNPAFPFYDSVYAGQGGRNDAEYITNTIKNDGITHIDYVIISHFHTDHVGAIGYMVKNKMIDRTTKIYCCLVDWGQISKPDPEAVRVESEFLTLCSQYNLSYIEPFNSTKLNFNNINVSFYNTKSNFADIYNYYKNGEQANANEFSLVARFEQNNKSILFTGDLGHKFAQNFNKNIIPRSNILIGWHHAHDYESNFDLFTNINPDSVITSNESIAKERDFRALPALCSLYKIPYSETCVNGDIIFGLNSKACYNNGKMSTLYPILPECDLLWQDVALTSTVDTEPNMSIATNAPLYNIFSLSDNNHVVNIPKSGVYLIQCTVAVRTTDQNSEVTAFLDNGGGNRYVSTYSTNKGNYDNVTYINLSTVIPVTTRSSSKVRLRVSSSSGGILYGTSGLKPSILKIFKIV